MSAASGAVSSANSVASSAVNSATSVASSAVASSTGNVGASDLIVPGTGVMAGALVALMGML